ncbi:MAG: hypothetical protein ABIR59_12610 [Gemmatimonadales bacterium]
MPGSPFDGLRRELVAAGAHPATTPWTELTRAGSGRETASVEILDLPFRHIPVGELEAWDSAVAFLDGSQHVELVGHVGTDPVVAAVIRAAVRERANRQLRVTAELSRCVVVARGSVLDRLAGVLTGHERINLDASVPPHPLHDLDRAHAAIDRARAALEVAVSRLHRAAHDHWIIVDGTLAVSPEWATDPRMIGVVKSHGALPFEGADLETYLTLPTGHRSSAFVLGGGGRPELHAWGLRLRAWEGHDLFHGLVRVEVAARTAADVAPDLLSGRLLAERSPLATGPRSDRMLYGIHDVGRYLRVRSAVT